MSIPTTQKVAVEVMAQIEKAAQATDARLRVVRVMGAEDAARQGDVYVALADGTEQIGAERGSRQVAVGDTAGSRHVAEGAVRVYERVGATEFEGPIVVAEERWTLTHPEHAHVSLPAGRYGVFYQADLATQRRVAD